MAKTNAPYLGEPRATPTTYGFQKSFYSKRVWLRELLIITLLFLHSLLSLIWLRPLKNKLQTTVGGRRAKSTNKPNKQGVRHLQGNRKVRNRNALVACRSSRQNLRSSVALKAFRHVPGPSEVMRA